MKSFKDIAYQVLKEVNQPLHSKEITKIALEKGWLNTAGKTPEATMNAQLIVDINSKKEKSRFIKTNLSTFALNPEFNKHSKKYENESSKERIYKISNGISSKQKGDIAEARIAELIALYGDTLFHVINPFLMMKG